MMHGEGRSRLLQDPLPLWSFWAGFSLAWVLQEDAVGFCAFAVSSDGVVCRLQDRRFAGTGGYVHIASDVFFLSQLLQ